MLMRSMTLTIVFALLSACAVMQDETPATNELAPQAMSKEAYLIGVDDQVSVNVWRDQELSVSMPVRPDGMITVPLVGDIQAGGHTPEEVASDIKKKLSRYIRNPDVTVILTELRSHEYLSRVRVTGAVENPISLPFRQGITALDAVLEAGGINIYAAPDRTRVYRKGGKETVVIDVRLGRILDKGDLGTNIYLQPGDVVSVPERRF